MNKLVKTLIATALASYISSIAYADDVEAELDAIEVVGQKIKEKDEAFKKSGAVSIRDEINNSSKDLDEIIRSTPGAFTQMNKAAGAVTVNIRGATGLGRVNSMVDGVTQTFYSSGGDTGTKGGGAGSQFGAAIDPLLLTSVEVNRGSFKGAGGANALVGSANFKTIGVDDILRLDKNFGGIVKYSFGDNDLRPEFMIGLAGKHFFDYGGTLGVLYAHTRKTITQDYQVGGGETHQQISERDTALIAEEYRRAYGDASPYDIRPFDPDKVKQKPQSHLFKIEYVDNYNTLGLQYRTLKNHLAGRSINTDTKQINYNFVIPNNDLVNFNFLYSKNTNSQNYDVGATIINRKILQPLQGKNKSTTIDINNIFKFNLPAETTLTLTPGFNWLKNDYSRNRYPDELRIFKVCENNPSPECVTSLGELNPQGKTNLYTKVNASLPTNSFFPPGDQKNKTIYFNNKLEWKIFTLDYNVNLVKSKTQGQVLTSTLQEYHKLSSEFDKLNSIKIFNIKDAEERRRILDRKDQLEKEMGAFDREYQWDDDNKRYRKNKTFINYRSVNHTFRNYSANLTADISHYFVPFVSYSKTHRAPTVQEIFFSSLTDAGVNLNLKPETARTKQIGFNGFAEGAITATDKFGYKVTAYRTEIDDFIHNVYTIQRIDGINPLHGRQLVPALRHRNHQEKVKIKGFEAELSYDMGKFFANLSYARQKTNQPASYSDIPRTASNVDESQAEAQSFGLTKVTILPNSYGSLEIGTRLFDNKVTIGAIAKYYGKSKRTKFDPIEICKGGRVYFDKLANRKVCPNSKMKDLTDRIGGIAEYEEIKSQPFVYDFYVMYEPTENLLLKLYVDNITDVRYVNPLDANNDAASQYAKLTHANKNANGDYFYTKEFKNNFARGRTFKFSLSYKF
ncbi:TonB-dependent receptor [Canicola haemoglobinophilus]|uniref:TonB-dependent receptor n=1 Tax=Canicola haemoglobinophilus TaxID=733 RepID=A0AB38HB35_9PAST|nr:TonB-dependent receptor [Canicola haemoglobinophilus]STO54056.1 TonB-dependent receptor [Canicola haemoglobinophilus]STO68589.1 TonB-dependent receptor [Canicola haemoglobinophilus]